MRAPAGRSVRRLALVASVGLLVGCSGGPASPDPVVLSASQAQAAILNQGDVGFGLTSPLAEHDEDEHDGGLGCLDTSLAGFAEGTTSGASNEFADVLNADYFGGAVASFADVAAAESGLASVASALARCATVEFTHGDKTVTLSVSVSNATGEGADQQVSVTALPEDGSEPVAAHLWLIRVANNVTGLLQVTTTGRPTPDGLPEALTTRMRAVMAGESLPAATYAVTDPDSILGQGEDDQVRLSTAGTDGEVAMQVSLVDLRCDDPLPAAGVELPEMTLIDYEPSPGMQACLATLVTTNVGTGAATLLVGDRVALRDSAGIQYAPSGLFLAGPAIAREEGHPYAGKADLAPGESAFDYALFEFPTSAQADALVFAD